MYFSRNYLPKMGVISCTEFPNDWGCRQTEDM